MSDPFFRSAELRWFWRGSSQLDPILRWFTLQGRLPFKSYGMYDEKATTGAFVKLEEERTDEYLLLPDCESVGVKQRQGKLEVKGLVAGPRPMSLDVAVGRVDQWIKWSFDPSEKTFQDGKTLAQQLDRELDQSGPWSKVVKNRYLQKYSFDSGNLVAVSPDERPKTGCNIEVTILHVDMPGEGTWLTFAFEAFGSSGRVFALLDESVAHYFVLHGPGPVQLEGRDSLSYPAWLAMLR